MAPAHMQTRRHDEAWRQIAWCQLDHVSDTEGPSSPEGDERGVALRFQHMVARGTACADLFGPQSQYESACHEQRTYRRLS
jgi:hypothetical protein